MHPRIVCSISDEDSLTPEGIGSKALRACTRFHRVVEWGMCLAACMLSHCFSMTACDMRCIVLAPAGLTEAVVQLLASVARGVTPALSQLSPQGMLSVLQAGPPPAPPHG